MAIAEGSLQQARCVILEHAAKRQRPALIASLQQNSALGKNGISVTNHLLSSRAC